MRKKLKDLDRDKRYTFVGIVERLGSKKVNYNWMPTLLLTSLKDANGNQLSDHVWINYSKNFQKLGLLVKGDKVKFNGRIKAYTKEAIVDEVNNVIIRMPSIDYAITYPSKVELLTKNTIKQPVPTDKKELLDYIRTIRYDMKTMRKYFSKGW